MRRADLASSWTAFRPRRSDLKWQMAPTQNSGEPKLAAHEVLLLAWRSEWQFVAGIAADECQKRES